MKKILITGGCGYVGSLMIDKFLSKYQIKNIDTQWFGNNLKNHENLINVKEDIRNLKSDFIEKNTYAVIHLANIANDPSVELDQVLSWEINVLAAKNLIEQSIKSGVKKFIYASSGSVYGVKSEDKVTEDLDLVPISSYNKTKMICERLLMSYKDQIEIFIVRPATVCGLSPRMRFDVSVNLLTLQALKNKVIKILGGNQTRPNINIKDMIRVYEYFIENNIKPGVYNAGFENMSILDLGKRIQEKVKQVGFEWENKEQVWEKVSEEIGELQHEVAQNNKEKMEDELGDVFFSLINYARFLNIDPETALEKTNKKFKHRFELMETYAKENGLDLAKLSLEEKEAIWQSMKSK
jgi:nucleoside-diphosphate-sugar epimerase